MKKLMFATALVASAAAFAEGATALNAISFEGYSENATFTNGTAEKGEDGNDKSGNPFFYYDGDGDGSSVKLFATGEAGAVTAPARPYYFQGVSPAEKYLELSTEGGTLWRSINPISVTQGETTTYGLGQAQAVAADGTYLDTLVQFTPTEDGNPPEVTQDDKLAIWLNVDSSGSAPVTNLMVKAGFVDDSGTSTSALPTNYVLTTASPVVAGTWYRLTIKAIADVTKCKTKNGEYNPNGITGFEIYLDGVQLSATSATFASGYINRATDASEYGWLDQTTDADFITYLQSGKVFPSLKGETSAESLQGIGFKGSGALDDIVWTEEDPLVAVALQFTLTWPAGVTPVSYTIGNGEPVAISGTSPFAVPGLAAGDVVKFIVANADGAQKTLTGTAGTDTGLDATGTTFGWPEYLGEAVAGAYEIDDADELVLFQKGVAAGLTTASTTFKLTDDVTLTAPWPGVGLPNGKDNYNKPVFTNEAFKGTFDGQNHTISGFQMVGVAGNPAGGNEGLDYCGFFNSTLGATIENLKIAYAGSLFAADTTKNTKESGATFVGVAHASTLRNLTTVSGTVSCSKGFGGISGYTTGGTVVEYCTNNVNMTSLAPNKCGGIAMITQGGSGGAIIRNCQNNGTIAGSGETGSIVGYIGLSTTIADCESTVAYKLMHRQSGTVTVQGTNKGLASVLAYSNATNLPIDGLAFATVDGNVATYVKVADFAMGNIYKVTGTAAIETTPTYRPGAIATFNFTAAGTIAFDTSLAVPTWNVTADEGLDLTFEDANNVRTYTAAAQGGDDYVVEIEGSDVVITPQAGDLEALAEAGVDTNSVAAVNAALATTIEGTSIPAWQALFLGVAPTTNGLETVAIKSITINAEGNVEIEMADGVTLKTGRGVDIKLKLMGSTDLTNWTQIGSDITNTKVIPAITPAQGETKKFYKVVVDFAGSSN